MDNRELDKRVALEVMGWKLSDNESYWMVGEQIAAIVVNWHPTKYIDAAFEVVEKLNEKYWVQINTTNVKNVVAYGVYGNFKILGSYTDESAPLAICKAALLSLEGRTT